MVKAQVQSLLKAAKILLADTNTKMVEGSERNQYLDAVWEMYLLSYKAIGYNISDPQEFLRDMQVWFIMFDETGKPHGFSAYKETGFGYKGIATGTNGSEGGKVAVKAHKKSVFERQGFYAEVSHAMERLIAACPKVCASDARDVLKKKLTFLPDAVHYKREITGVGMTTKIMVGKPKGVDLDKKCEIPEDAEVEEISDSNNKHALVDSSKRDSKLDKTAHDTCDLPIFS